MYVAQGFDVFLSLIYILYICVCTCCYIYITHTLYSVIVIDRAYIIPMCVCVDSHKVSKRHRRRLSSPKVLYENNLILQYSITVVYNNERVEPTNIGRIQIIGPVNSNV